MTFPTIVSHRGTPIAAAILVAIAAACASPAPVGDGSRLPAVEPEDQETDASVVLVDDQSDSGGPSPTDAASHANFTTKLCSEPDLLLCFSFEGEVKDGSPNAFAPTSFQGVTFGPGKAGQAAVLTDRSFIRFASAPLVSAPATTIEAWVNASQRVEGVIFDADERYAMTALADGSLRCVGQGADVRGGVVALGSWTHVACVYDGNKVRAYVNGVLLSTGNGNTGKTTAGAAAIGGNAPTGQPFVGAIDSFRLFKVARSDAQIAASAAGN